jgi:hypothetical protein
MGFTPDYPELFHPFASVIDSELPKAPTLVHMTLGSKASWVEPEIGPGDKCFEQYPGDSLEEWHRSRGLGID